jgi:hypothetical protein
MVPLFLIAEPGRLGDHLASRQVWVRQPGQASRQTPGRPAAQRRDHRLARVAGYRAELGQQLHQPGNRHSGFQVVIPVGGVQRLPGRLVISVAQVMQRRMHRPPQAAGARHAILAKHREQRHHQQAHAVFALRVRLRRAHRAQGRQPSGQQVRIARRPALQRRTAAHPPATDLQQARRDRDAPGPVQRPDVGHRAQPRRHVHADSRARRHVGLAQHLPGGHRTAARPHPASQRNGPAHDNAFTRKPRRIAKLIPGNRHVHIWTLLPAGGGVGNELLCPRLNCALSPAGSSDMTKEFAAV